MTAEMWQQLLTLLIPVLTPLITAGVKKIAPSVPKLVLWVLNPILGAVIGGLGGSGVEVGTLLGVAGVGVREGVDQTKKAITKGVAASGCS